MKKTIIVLIILSFIVGCGKNTNELKSENNIPNEQIKYDENSIINNNNVDEISKLYSSLYDELTKKGNEIYSNQEHLNFDTKNDVYFISLRQLNQKYNYDISIFK